METYIIKLWRKGFWTGSEWSKEYPNAKEYHTSEEVMKAADSIPTSKSISVDIYKNYGYGTEKRYFHYVRKNI